MGAQPSDYQDANLREATLLMQAKGYEAEYWHTGGGVWCMHVHSPNEYCYEFGTSDEMFGYQGNNDGDCSFADRYGYAKDVRSDAPALALAEWAHAVIQTRAPFSCAGVCIEDPTYDEFGRFLIDGLTYWNEGVLRG